MTYQVKEGDVLEYRGDGPHTSAFSFKKGKNYTVQINNYSIFIVDEYGKRATGVLGDVEAFGFHLVSTTPPETIQHEGYNYTRGEPVVPEWVKDGAWIVDKEDGAVSQLFICGNSAGVHGYTETDYGSIDLCDVADVFRPFTNEDWKWGMWAEYKGEKVFIMSEADTAGNVEISKKPIYKKALSSFTIALSSELTPTTAP